jgi:hypothetical protein
MRHVCIILCAYLYTTLYIWRLGFHDIIDVWAARFCVIGPVCGAEDAEGLGLVGEGDDGLLASSRVIQTSL